MRYLTTALVCLIANFAFANESACLKLDEFRKNIREFEQEVLQLEASWDDSESCEPISGFKSLSCGTHEGDREYTKLMREKLDTYLKELRDLERYCRTQ